MNRFWTIRTRFLIFGLLSLIPLLGFNWLLVSDNNRTRYEDLTANQQVLSSQVTNSLSGYLTGSFRGLENLASNPVILENDDVDATTTLLGQSRTTRPEFVGLFMLNTNGELVSQAGILDPTILPKLDSQVEGVLASGQRSISGRIDLQLDPPTSVYVMLVPITSVTEATSTSPNETPVADEDDALGSGPGETPPPDTAKSPGTVRGVIGAVIPTEGLAQATIPTIRGRTEVVVLADNQVIAATGDVRGNEKAFIDNLRSQDTAFSDEGSDVFKMKSLTGTDRSAILSPVQMESPRGPCW